MPFFWAIGLHLCRWSFVLIPVWSRNGKGWSRRNLWKEVDHI